MAKIIVVGTDIETSRQAVALAEKQKGLFASIGLHPHEFNQDTFTKLEYCKQELKKLAESSNKVIAIGECGLDYFVREEPITDEMKARQKEGFLAQLNLARDLKLPVIVHTRPSAGTMDAYEDLYSILKSKILNLKSAILHCYQGDTIITQKFLKLPNVYFSFAGNLTYPVKKSLAGTQDDLRETLKLIPLDKLFVETDSPFLAPAEKRGLRNEPIFVWFTARKICALKNIEMSVLEKVIDENFQNVFSV